MQLSEFFKVVRCLLFALLCFVLLSVCPCLCSSNSLQCLDENSLAHHPIRRHFFDEDPASKALVAASKAHLSQVVFKGTLMSVLVQRDGVVKAAFALDQVLKPLDDGLAGHGELEVVYFQRKIGTDADSDEDCLFEVNEENLKLGNQYVVFGRSVKGTRTAVTASAFPIPFDKRTFKAMKRVVCKGCARPPRIAGLKNVRIVEKRKLRLHCHLSGNPIPWVEWYKDGQLIDSLSNPRVKLRTKRRTSRLTIRQSRLRDQGVYECRAVNIVKDSPTVAKANVTITKKTTTKKPQLPKTTTTVSSFWPTEKCPNSDFCLNGGTCIFYKDVWEYVCHCAEGYVGLRCDYKDVKSSLGGIKSIERDHNRLFVTVVILFVVLSCLNWGSLIACWICCFRSQRNDLRRFRQRAPLAAFFKSQRTSLNQTINDNNHRLPPSPSCVITSNTENVHDEQKSYNSSTEIRQAVNLPETNKRLSNSGSASAESQNTVPI